MATTYSYGQEMVSIYLIKIKITTIFFNFILVPTMVINLVQSSSQLYLIHPLGHKKQTRMFTSSDEISVIIMWLYKLSRDLQQWTKIGLGKLS